MSEIVAACVSQFHDDANSFELLLAYSDGREVGHSVSRSVAQRIAAELVTEVGGEYDAKDAEIAKLREENDRLREALAPFAAVAQHDIGEDEANVDLFKPISSPNNRAPLLRVGDFRRTLAALANEPTP